jgi:hypothetical protein
MSIINDKYKGKKFEKDWLANLLDANATKTKTVTKSTKDEDGNVTKTEEERPAGVDVDKLIAIGDENKVDLAKLKAARGTGENGADPHGFAGRARMTIRNQLQTVAKQRHGLVIGGEFVSAPADWLTAKQAPAEPTHTQAGEKIAKAQPAKEEAEAA